MGKEDSEARRVGDISIRTCRTRVVVRLSAIRMAAGVTVRAEMVRQVA